MFDSLIQFYRMNTFCHKRLRIQWNEFADTYFLPTGSWEMHLAAISKCLPIFAAAGHFNYLLPEVSVLIPTRNDKSSNHPSCSI